MAVNTGKVTGRRTLRFSKVQDILGDVHHLQSVPTKQLGNWTLGQICEHLAKVFDMAIDGPPFKPPLFIRLLAPFLKKRFLSRPMSAGFTLPKRGATLLPDRISDEAGVALLEKAIARFQADSTRKPHLVLGPITHAEWDQLEMRHSEMHLSFIVPEGAA